MTTSFICLDLLFNLTLSTPEWISSPVILQFEIEKFINPTCIMQLFLYGKKFLISYFNHKSFAEKLGLEALAPAPLN